MGKRRDHGEGTVHRRADGRWAGAFTTGFKNGARVRKYVYGKTKGEAAAKLRDAQRQFASGLALPDERTTVGNYLSWWVTEVAPGSVKPSTAVGYKYMLDRHVIPHIGHLRSNPQPSDP